MAEPAARIYLYQHYRRTKPGGPTGELTKRVEIKAPGLTQAEQIAVKDQLPCWISNPSLPSSKATTASLAAGSRDTNVPKGPQGQKRPADVIRNIVQVIRIATGQEEEAVSKTKRLGAKLEVE